MAFDDVDIITGYGDDTGELLKTISKDPLLSEIPAVKRGSTYLLPGTSPLATAANPTPLSIGYAPTRTPPPSPEAADKVK
ncbi:Iron-siderophore ABC transporter substrate-binding protein OS=Streptomyces cyaneofuscatus OX=66883 GN=G3I52_00570 PE=3 SV=1 [Streptomyces cyaneofuscatus]